jgi:hypothetical protein
MERAALGFGFRARQVALGSPVGSQGRGDDRQSGDDEKCCAWLSFTGKSDAVGETLLLG